MIYKKFNPSAKDPMSIFNSDSEKINSSIAFPVKSEIII
jgi:hypothetical protein